MKRTMIKPSVTELLDKVDNRYRLVTVTARRARQIIAGQDILVEGDRDKPLTTAIDEVDGGLIQYEAVKESLK